MFSVIRRIAASTRDLPVRRLSGRLLCAGSLLLAFPIAADGQQRGYPRSYADIVSAAKREGSVIVYSSTDLHEVAGLLAAFRRTYPFLRVDYRELESPELYKRVVNETRTHRMTGDLIWSSAMDLQIKLVNDGYAQPYASPEKPYLPPWAIWKNEAWGVTAEPVVFAYNRRLVPAADVPRTHGDFDRLLRRKIDSYSGRVATIDPRLSGSGYLQLTQDYQISRDVLSLVSAMGKAQVKLQSSTRPLLAELMAGKSALAYNVLGSYAMEVAARNKVIGVVMPSDYTLVVSRIALITREARHPHAAKLFLDFLLSRQGQTELARSYMTPSRDDVPTRPGTKPSPAIARPVRLGPALLANLDSIKQKRFLANWQQALANR